MASHTAVSTLLVLRFVLALHLTCLYKCGRLYEPEPQPFNVIK